jgi:UDP-N-acetylglucosamine 3-dehydrogenase
LPEDGKLRVGVIGGGIMAKTHVLSLLAMAPVKFAGLAAPEVSPEVAKLCAGAGLPASDDVAGLLGSGGLDAVVIATPTDTHPQLVEEAAGAGLHVFCEKPLGLDETQARAAVGACEQAGVKLAVGHVVRYFPAYAKIRDLVKRGEIGSPAMAKCRRMSGAPGEVRPWYADGQRSGGVVTDMGVHDFDWLLWCLGPVERVSALSAERGPGQVAMVVLAHQGGAISSVELSWMDPTGFWTAVEVSGPGGLLRHDSRSTATFRVDRARAGAGSPEVEVPVGEPLSDPYYDELADALGWFGGGPPPRGNADDAVAAVALAEAARLSASTRETVTPGMASA